MAITKLGYQIVRFLLFVLALSVVAGCALLKDNKNSYLYAKSAAPLKLPALFDETTFNKKLGKNRILGDTRPIPEARTDDTLPSYPLPRRPQPAVWPELKAQKATETFRQQQKRPYSATNRIYTNTDGQPMLSLVSAGSGWQKASWQRINAAIDQMAVDVQPNVSNTYYSFTYKGDVLRALQIRTREAISIVIQDQNNDYVDPSLAEELLLQIQIQLTRL